MSGGLDGIGSPDYAARLLDRLEKLLELERKALVALEPERVLELSSDRLELQQRLSEVARRAPDSIPARRLEEVARKNRRNLRLVQAACSAVGALLDSMGSSTCPTYGSSTAGGRAGVVKTVA